MKLNATLAKKQAPVYEVSSAEELLRQVDHYHPELTGWLKKLRDAFAAGGSVEETEPVDGTANCPSCGVELKINEQL